MTNKLIVFNRFGEEATLVAIFPSHSSILSFNFNHLSLVLWLLFIEQTGSNNSIFVLFNNIENYSSSRFSSQIFCVIDELAMISR